MAKRLPRCSPIIFSSKAELDVAVAGNMGKSFAGQLAESDHEFWVLEVSSFQLDDIRDFKPNIAVLLNITPDHLDRYDGKIQNYADAKFAITRNLTQEDHFIYCDDDAVIAENMKNRAIKAELHPISIYHPVENGAYISENKISINLTNKPFEMSIHDLALQGKHNAYNSMAASVSARIFDLRKELVRDSLSDYENVEHRLEFVAEIHGIKFINDSKATNVNSTWYALESVNEKMVWIVGGVDKGNNYSILEPLVREKVKAIICLGTDNKKLLDYFGNMVPKISRGPHRLQRRWHKVMHLLPKMMLCFCLRHAPVSIYLKIMKIGDNNLNALFAHFNKIDRYVR